MRLVSVLQRARVLMMLALAAGPALAGAQTPATPRVPVGQSAVDAAARAAGVANARNAATDGLIDINRATPKELAALPGIGEATAQKIVRARPFANKAQLVSRGILTEAVYERVKDQVIARKVPQ